MKRLIILTLVFILFFLTACTGTEAPEASASPTANPAESESAVSPSATEAAGEAGDMDGEPAGLDEETAAKIQEDLEFLLKELKANYPYADSIKESLWPQYIPEVQSILGQYGMSNALYLEILGLVLADTVTTNVGLAPVGLGEFLTASLSGENETAARFHELASEPNTREFYADLAVETEGIPDTGDSDTVMESTLLPGGKAAYLRIPKFGNMADNGDREALKSFLDTVMGTEAIIIDIRGNNGDCPPEKWTDIVELLAVEKTISRSTALVRGGETIAAANNSFVSEEGMSFTELKEANLPSGIDPSMKSLFAYEKTVETAIEPAPDSIQYGGKVYILTDGATSGQMDAFARHAEQSGFAVLAGAATGGLGVSSGVVYTALPGTGMIVRYASEYGINGDGTASLRNGVAPQIDSGGADALEAVIKIVDPTANAEEIARSVKPMNPIVTIEMENGGVITVELYPDIAPNTVANFVNLIETGFYDGTIFHRVIPGFMIQGGDPDGTGMGGPSHSIAGEFTSNGFKNELRHSRGVISMARSSHPDSAGSQFFIMHADYPSLDGNYAAFGKVTSGIEVVDEIAALKTGANDRPENLPIMKKVTVDTGGTVYSAQKLTGIR